MYGMYGKMGAGYPLKIPYIIGHTVHRQGHFLRRQAAGNDRLREVQRERLAHGLWHKV